MQFFNRIKKFIVQRMLNIPTRSKYKFIVSDWVQLKDLDVCAKVLETKRFMRNLRPIELYAPSCNRILVIAPHEDDDMIGAGGTILKAIQQGTEVHVLYISRHKDASKADAIRKQTLDISRIVGYIPHFLDVYIQNIPIEDADVNMRFVQILEQVNPNIMFTTFLLDDHDDHRRVNELLLQALRFRPLPSIEIWAYQVYSTVIPNIVIDITDFAQRKKEIIALWKAVSGERNWAHYVLGMNAANSRFIASHEPKYVEGFFVVPLQEYLELCRQYFFTYKNVYYNKNYI